MRAECVIIGGGFAGIATAYQLTQRGIRDVLILEQERAPGKHSSGRNAGMIRQVVFDEEIAPLAREGARHIRDLAAAAADRPGLFQSIGSVLLGGGRRWERLVAAGREAIRHDVSAELWKKDAVEQRTGVTAGGAVDGAIFTRSDGAVDPRLLLETYLRRAEDAGARLLEGCLVRAVYVDRARSIAGVGTARGDIRTGCVVNAAGAWAAHLGRLATATAIPLVPHRRHLFHTGTLRAPRYEGPILWNEDHQVYLRPQDTGLLASPCDETPAEPGIPPASAEMEKLLRQKLARAFPTQADLPLVRSWAGLRTFTPDGRFVIGPDPAVKGFFWVAGLGGHGVTVSAAVGRLAADLIEAPSLDEANPFSPSRFVEEYGLRMTGD